MPMTPVFGVQPDCARLKTCFLKGSVIALSVEGLEASFPAPIPPFLASFAKEKDSWLLSESPGNQSPRAAPRSWCSGRQHTPTVPPGGGVLLLKREGRQQEPAVGTGPSVSTAFPVTMATRTAWIGLSRRNPQRENAPWESGAEGSRLPHRDSVAHPVTPPPPPPRDWLFVRSWVVIVAAAQLGWRSW